MKPFEQFNDIVTACSEKTQKQVQQDMAFEPLYLYYKESTEKENGELVFIKESQTAPEGFKLAHGEPLRSNVPYSNYWTWIREKCLRLPILAWGN